LKTIKDFYKDCLKAERCGHPKSQIKLHRDMGGKIIYHTDPVGNKYKMYQCQKCKCLILDNKKNQ